MTLKKRDLTSKVPKYTFSDILKTQQKELRSNPLTERFATSRKRLSNDPYRPLYHFVSPESTMNDPNGLCYWKGRWHLFYQAYPPEDRRQHWGHAVSYDLIHWQDLPYAIYPNPESHCYSGSCFVESTRVIAMYHGVGAGNMVAVAEDPLLLNWKKPPENPVIPMKNPDGSERNFRIFDPCIWRKGNYYYSLSAGQRPEGPGGKMIRADMLLRSEDLIEWEALHEFVEDDMYSLVGDDGACPYFWPIGNKHMLLYFSHMSGGKYLLGDYDKENDKFHVTDGGRFNFGTSVPSGVHAPSACPDGQGNVNVIFNMNSGKPGTEWNQIMSLPRKLSLDQEDSICPLRIEPAGDIKSLRKEHEHLDNIKLPANEEVVLPVGGNAVELHAVFASKDVPVLELNVLRSSDGKEKTRIRFFREKGFGHREMKNNKGATPYSIIVLDTSESSVLPDVNTRPPEKARVQLEKNESLDLRIFIDKSIVEVFANGKQCVAARVYPGKEDSTGISIVARGKKTTLETMDIWQMKSIYN